MDKTPADSPSANIPTAPNGTSSRAERFGRVVNDALQRHVVFVIIGIFVAGGAFVATIYEKAAPWRYERDYQSLLRDHAELQGKVNGGGGASAPHPSLKPVKFPIRVGVVGPLTGPYADFGLSQVRGVLGGILHALTDLYGLPQEQWRRHFQVTPVNSDVGGSDPVIMRERLVKAFQSAQDNHDVVFGPMSSQEAITVLLNGATNLKVPTLLTTAATVRVREIPEYGKLVFQVSPNIDSYAAQYMRYVGQFLEPKPRYVYIVYRDDEYGRSSSIALAKYANEHRIRVTSVRIPMFDSTRETLDEYVSAVFAKNRQIVEELRNQSTESMVLIADTGATLRGLLSRFRKTAAGLRMGTLTSPDAQEVASGQYEGLYLIYSFAPVQFSLDTVAFYKYSRDAERYLEEIIPQALIPAKWPKLDTVDAEVHDATAYWLKRFISPVWPAPGARERNLFVTNFLLHGGGPELQNVGALYLFQVRNRRIEPIVVDF